MLNMLQVQDIILIFNDWLFCTFYSIGRYISCVCIIKLFISQNYQVLELNTANLLLTSSCKN